MHDDSAASTPSEKAGDANTDLVASVRDVPSEEAGTRLAELFAAVGSAWAQRDFAAVRETCAQALVMPGAARQDLAYAQLRIAASYRAEGRPIEAKTEYEKIRNNPVYLPHHRAEAEELILEIDRMLQGLPARDPKASRTQVAHFTRAAVSFWIAPDGNDAHAGTETHPFATLTRARDAIRTLDNKSRSGPIVVWIKPGEYRVTESFALNTKDSGTEDAPVIYRAERQDSVVFRGGKRIHGFTTVTDPAILARLPEVARGKVMQCDLRQCGINEYGTLQRRGFGISKETISTLELYFNGQPMTLARYPNEGFIDNSRPILDDAAASKMVSTFEYDGDRPSRWIKACDLWLSGYWRNSWADQTLAVKAIDPQKHRITTVEPYMDTEGIDIPAYMDIPITHRMHYVVFNLLEEIDMPGEWYLERETGILYFYPPSDPALATVEVSTFPAPMVTLTGCDYVRFEGITFDLGRHDGVHITGGRSCLLAGCTLSRFAGGGVNIEGGFAHGIIGCDIFTLGRHGTLITGGDRETLVPSGHVLENCHIYAFSRIDRTYTPAVRADGVGVRIAHNLIHDNPCHAICISGNDHLVEYNEVHSVCRESDDQGAADMFGNPTFRGVVFRYNYFHHIGGLNDYARAGIRLDDAISGVLIYGNIFYRSAQGHFGAVQINSGRENIVENNLIADSKQAFSGGWTPHWSDGNTFWQMFHRGEEPAWTRYIMSDLYLARYPRLKDMRTCKPVNHLWRNVIWNSGSNYMHDPNHRDILELAIYGTENPGFADPARGDFRSQSAAPLYQRIGFRPIPVEEIGLYNDTWRATWPVESKPSEVPDWRLSAACL